MNGNEILEAVNKFNHLDSLRLSSGALVLYYVC